MASEMKRIDVGFQGGQVLQLRLKESAYKELQKALGTDTTSGWHEIESEDSDFVIDLGQVVYVRLETDSHRVGF